MRKKIIDEIVKKPCFPFGKTVQMTASERAELRSVMEAAGAGWQMLYQRMAYRGFDMWEISGIEHCVSDFWSMAHSQSEEIPTKPDLQNFFQTLVEQGSNVAFIKYMEAHGMSRNTTIKRFTEINFKEWEVDGVESVLRRIEE